MLRDVGLDRLQQLFPVFHRLVVFELAEFAFCLRVQQCDAFAERIAGRRRFDDRNAPRDARELGDHLRVKERVDLVQIVKRNGGIVRVVARRNHRGAAAQQLRAKAREARDLVVAMLDDRDDGARVHGAAHLPSVRTVAAEQHLLARAQGHRLADQGFDMSRFAFELVDRIVREMRRHVRTLSRVERKLGKLTSMLRSLSMAIGPAAQASTAAAMAVR